MERQKLESEKSVYELIDELSLLEPKLVTNFTPDKEEATIQKQKFLAGEIDNPQHTYSKVNSYNYSDEIAKINQAGYAILFHRNLNPKHRFANEDVINQFSRKAQIMELARLYNNSNSSRDKLELAQDYLKLGTEVYGEIDEITYRSLLQEKLDRINDANYTGEALDVRRELFEMTKYNPNGDKVQRFSPSKDTINWAMEFVTDFYGGLLRHIPEKDTFSPNDARDVFEEIIKSEFGDFAGDWQIELGDSDSIKVVVQDKKIIIPSDRKDMDYQEMKRKTIHEIGVHFFRYVMGSDTDAPLMRVGWGSSYNAEEGLAITMSQAARGKYSEGGIEPYISAGLVYFDKMDFRKAFEIKWRLSALHKAKKSGEITDEVISDAKDKAYSSMSRCLRGTDELPFFKDLSYYNGSADIWKYLERIKGDELEMMILLSGKIDPISSDHRRLVLESSSERSLSID